jgi:3-deoxy-D-manno-octulosonate 8-phosphate phosphatase (KDO 8-P phosphatase)
MTRVQSVVPAPILPVAAECRERMARVQLLVLDVDGVMTDGSILMGSNQEEFKAFSTKDGLGLKLLMESGIRVGIITGRRPAPIELRCRELGINAVRSGVSDKAKAIDEICGEFGVPPENAAFMGDDLPDLPAMRKVGLAIAVADAHPVVKSLAHVVTRTAGGDGAVREICEALLEVQGRWSSILERYLTA